MSATLVVIIAAIIFIVSVRLKVPLGIAFTVSGIVLGFLSGMGVVEVLSTSGKWLISEDTIGLILIVYFLGLMGVILGELGWLSRTVRSLKRLIPNSKISSVLPASLIGFLPMPGGAMLSAPLVEEGAKTMELSRERLTFLNFWFRHLWEYTWPLYPGIILSTVLLDVPASKLISSMWYLSVFSIIPGLVIGFRGVKNAGKNDIKEIGLMLAIKDFLITTWYIWAVVFFVLFLGFEILPIVAIASMITLLILRQSDKKRLEHLKKAFSIKVIGLIAGVMIFKGILESSGTVEVLAKEIAGVPEVVLLFLVPFSIGIITGVNSAFVGLGFPVLVPLIMKNGFDAGNFAFAYTAGFLGVLSSPVHLCLLLTKQYFYASWSGIYKFLAPAVISVFLASIVLLLIQ
ncbi:DUF401 family protein [bacterium]|nr:DUF401 family protein [bacterium]